MHLILYIYPPGHDLLCYCKGLDKMTTLNNVILYADRYPVYQNNLTMMDFNDMPHPRTKFDKKLVDRIFYNDTVFNVESEICIQAFY
jgi:hypothetical protein